MIRRSVWGLVAGLLLAPAIASAADIEVIVEGVRPTGGLLRIALFSQETAAHYPYEDGVMTTLTHPADSDTVTIVFADLPPDDYAMAVLHDADEDGKMTRSLFGLPLEGYGFSNGASGFLGPPPFKAARVRIGPGAAQATAIVPLYYP